MHAQAMDERVRVGYYTRSHRMCIIFEIKKTKIMLHMLHARNMRWFGQCQDDGEVIRKMCLSVIRQAEKVPL